MEWTYVALGVCSNCDLPDKRLWRPAPPPAEKGTLRIVAYWPICVRCRVAYETRLKEPKDGQEEK